MTQDKIIRDCENLLDGSTEDPLYQMMLVMMNYIMQMDAERNIGAAISGASAEIPLGIGADAFFILTGHKL